MKYDIFFLDDELGTITEFHGTLTDDLLIQCAKERFSYPERNKKFKYIITDFSNSNEIDISVSTVKIIAQMAIEVSKVNKNITVASAMPKDLVFGLGRMWQAYADETGWNSHMFHSRVEAENWVKEQLNEDLNFNY